MLLCCCAFCWALTAASLALLRFLRWINPLLGVSLFLLALFGAAGAYIIHYNANIRPHLKPPKDETKKNKKMK